MTRWQEALLVGGMVFIIMSGLSLLWVKWLAPKLGIGPGEPWSGRVWAAGMIGSLLVLSWMGRLPKFLLLFAVPGALLGHFVGEWVRRERAERERT